MSMTSCTFCGHVFLAGDRRGDIAIPGAVRIAGRLKTWVECLRCYFKHEAQR